METFAKLQPVTYNYKTNKKEPVVGFIAEDVPDAVAPMDHKSLSALEMVALLTKVVQTKEKEMEAMKKRLSKVEALLTNIALTPATTDKEKVSLNSN
jgi:hypothetical protein